MFPLTLPATDIARIIQPDKNQHVFSELNEMVGRRIRSFQTPGFYVEEGNETITSKDLIQSIRKTLQSELCIEEINAFSSFKVTLSHLSDLASIHKVSKAFMGFFALNLSQVSKDYEDLLQLAHTVHNQTYIDYHQAFHMFQTFLYNPVLPAEYKILEDYHSLLSMQLVNETENLSIGTKRQLIINETVYPKHNSLVVPPRIHIENVEFSSAVPSHIEVSLGSTIKSFQAHPHSTIRFEDPTTEQEFRQNNHTFFSDRLSFELKL
jgi:hypothetical protein